MKLELKEIMALKGSNKSFFQNCRKKKCILDYNLRQKHNEDVLHVQDLLCGGVLESM